MLACILSDEINLIVYDNIESPTYLKKKVIKALNTDDDDCSRTSGIPKIITIKIGAKIMIIINIDITKGLVNGTIGTIKSVSKNIIDKEDIQSVTIILSSGMEHIIERVSVKFEIMKGAFIERKQYPFSLSYGVTIHKSQGLTLQSAIIDIGNNVFACGQSYVALSRVTSLEGLHLINFDPSSIKANLDAIVEYNRLRKNLPILDTQTNTVRKTFDNLWVAPAEAVKSQTPMPNDIQSRIWSLQGLPNIDGVSCYANSVIQCIFHCNTFRDEVLNLRKAHALRKSLLNYNKNASKTIDIVTIRKLVHETYTDQVQQDAAEFLLHLLNKVEILKNIVLHELKYKIMCLNKQCTYTNTIIQPNVIICLPVNSTAKRSVTLQELIDSEFSKQEQIEAICDVCCHKYKGRKVQICSTKKVVILQLLLFQNNGLETRKNNQCFIKSVPQEECLINNHKYRVISAIFHHGESMEVGHYTAMLRKGKSWIKANDLNISQNNWPRNAKESYIFFLEINS